jgi:signal transduction histidine kinase
LLLGVIASLARRYDSELADVIQVVILLGGLVAIPVVIGSARIRNTARAFIARNLYEYKYDYRDEWIRVTRQLLLPHPDDPLPIRVIRTLAEPIHSVGGALWRFNRQGLLVPQAQYRVHWPERVSRRLSRELMGYFSGREWIVDLTKLDSGNNAEAAIDLREFVRQMPSARFLIPLQIDAEVYGLVVLREPSVQMKIIWEDFDVLKNIARQAAGVLALQKVDTELQATLQLRAFHQGSAFIVHDLKTVISQLQLLLQNAQKHRDNPAFIDDMLETTNNATQRMGKLLAQLQEPQAQHTEGQTLNIEQIVRATVAEFMGSIPLPEFSGSRRHGNLDPTISGTNTIADSIPSKASTFSNTDAYVHGTAQQIRTAVAHLIQNAIEATPAEGKVRVAVARDDDWIVISIADSGRGMDERFIETRLFQPFESTKGLTGMGMGVYQSREIARALGGELTITSTPDVGSEFSLHLPAARTDDG